MSQIYNKLKIDVKEKNTDIITAKQNDSNSRFLDVYLYDGGVPLDLTGHEVRIYMRKPDKMEVFNNGEITNATAGRCQFELTDQALGAEGYLECEISVWYENTQILTTQIFKIFVAESLRSDGSIESSNEYGALVVLFQNLYQSIDLMQSMVELFGQPGEVAAEAKIATFWQMLEYLYGVNAAALKNSSVNEVLDRIGLSSEGNTLFEVVEPLNELIDKLPKGSVKSVQRGLITLAGTVNTATATISTVDISKSIVLSTGYLTSNGGQDGMYTLTHLVLTDSTTVTAQRGATGNVVVTIPYQVVEFY